MKMFKSWKEKVKKIGAVGIAMGLLASNAAVHAEENDGKIVIEEGGTETENLIKGYQTELEDVYMANITWGKMTFVYDRGVYSTKDGSVVPSADLGDPEAGKTITAGENKRADINCWRGFT